jgi:prepilin-type N-terminal cleavage/methylation domain-containing protein
MKHTKGKNKLHISYFKLHDQEAGFTLMEIIVATTIFAIVTVALLGLFNYVLKINRRSQALAQASEGMRNFVEFLAKEIQNGQIDYYVANGSSLVPAFSVTSPCGPPASLGSNTYYMPDNKLGIINTDNLQECFYYGKANGSYADTIGGIPLTFSSSTGATALVMQESGVSTTTPQILNPPNFRIDNLMFLIKPLCDPYTPTCTSYGNSYPKIQPSVTIIIKFVTSLPTGEQVPIYYQTTVSSNKYDIPNH